MACDSRFTAKQTADLGKSGISVETALRCGLFNEEDPGKIRKMLGFDTGSKLAPALVFPYYPGGDQTKNPMFFRLKPDHASIDPTGGARKYLQPRKTATKIYIPPIMDQEKLVDCSAPLFLTEGEKKAIKMNLEGFTCVSAPGVWNFHDPTQRETAGWQLRECFGGIPLAGRQIYIVFDLLEFQKHDVLLAKVTLADMLVARGSEVRLLHLSDDEIVRGVTEDLGIDDYLSRYGVGSFREKILAGAFHYPLGGELERMVKIADGAQRERLARKLLGYYVLIKNPMQKELIKENLVKKLGFSKKFINDYDRESRRGRRNQIAITEEGSETDGKTHEHIRWGNDREFSQRCLELRQSMQRRHLGYRIGNIPTFINAAGELCSIANLEAFRGFLAEYFEFYCLDREGNREFISPPAGDVAVVFNNPTYFDTLREIVATASHPIYDENFNPHFGGYDGGTKIYVKPSSILAGEGTQYIDQILQDGYYVDDGSKVNRLAGWLTSFFPTLFMGDKPMILWQANQRGAGKSWGAETDAIIRVGRHPITVTYTQEEAELEKQLAAAVLAGANEIMIDNAKVMVRCPEISSSVLERSITGAEISYRILGQSKMIVRPNSLQFSLTANCPRLSSDLISRSMIINLYCEGDPATRTFKLKDPRIFAAQHRDKILGELMGMIERWKLAGCPRHQASFRFKRFAEIIGGILEVNGYRGFLDNAKTAEAAMSSDYSDLQDLFSAHPDLHGSAKDFAQKALSMELFKGEFFQKKGLSLYRIMAAIMTRYVGYSFTLESGQIMKLRAKYNSNRKSRDFHLEPQARDSSTADAAWGEGEFCGDLGDGDALSPHRNPQDNAPAAEGKNENYGDSGDNALETNIDNLIEVSDSHTHNTCIYIRREVIPASPAGDDNHNDCGMLRCGKTSGMPHAIPADGMDSNDNSSMECGDGDGPVMQPLLEEKTKYEFWIPATGPLGDRIAFDTETELAQPGVVPRFVLGQAYAGGASVFLVKREHLAAFFAAHAASTLIMHNAPFDIAVICKACEVDFAPFIEMDRLWDTGLLYQLLILATEGDVPRRWGLAAVAKEVLGIVVSKDEALRNHFGDYITEDGSIAYAAITEAELEYAAKDAIVTYEIFTKVFPRVCELDPRQYLSHRIQLMGAIGLHAIELNGIGMDLERRASLINLLDEKIQIHLAQLAHHGYVPGEEGINTLLQGHLKDLETKLGIALPKTDKSGAISSTHKVLEPYRDHSPLIAALLDYRELKKTRDFVAELDQPRIYPRFNTLLHTGRTSCHNPNLQNMPRAAGIRECFIPAPGYKFLIIDYAQIELSTLAQVCMDRYGISKMAELINQSVDLHRWFASVLLNKNIEEITKEERQRAKACNFGFPGGLGTTAFLAYAKATYGIEGMSIEQAEQYRNRWLEAFPEMKLYLADDSLSRLKKMYDFSTAGLALGFPCDEESAAKLFMKILSGGLHNNLGHPYGSKTLQWAFEEVLPKLHQPSRGIAEGSPDLKRQILDLTAVQTRTGRIRAACTYTAARNTPFQGLASDGAKIALYRLRAAGYRVCNFIHDEFVIELPDRAGIEDQAVTVDSIAVSAMRQVVPDVAVRTEWFITERWRKG